MLKPRCRRAETTRGVFTCDFAVNEASPGELQFRPGPFLGDGDVMGRI